MNFVFDTLWKAFFIQFGMILGGNILPIILHACFGAPYMIQ
jgi:hypothetical protein